MLPRQSSGGVPWPNREGWKWRKPTNTLGLCAHFLWRTVKSFQGFSPICTLCTAITHVFVSLALWSFTCAEAPQLQYFNHLSECSVQWANGTRNRETTAPLRWRCNGSHSTPCVHTSVWGGWGPYPLHVKLVVIFSLFSCGYQFWCYCQPNSQQ